MLRITTAHAALDSLMAEVVEDTFGNTWWILRLLAAGELCVCNIVDILGVPQPTVSRHLAYLRRMGLVDATREWKFAHYRLAEPGHAVHQSLINCVRTCFRGISTLDKERRKTETRVALEIRARHIAVEAPVRRGTLSH
ncbi:MAG: metalloregulator ArsR/SmtB family transcription factor [Gemmatimonadaceae bacterium]